MTLTVMRNSARPGRVDSDAGRPLLDTGRFSILNLDDIPLKTRISLHRHTIEANRQAKVLSCGLINKHTSLSGPPDVSGVPELLWLFMFSIWTCVSIKIIHLLRQWFSCARL